MDYLKHVIEGHKEIVNLMISKGANNWNNGLLQHVKKSYRNSRFNDF